MDSDESEIEECSTVSDEIGAVTDDTREFRAKRQSYRTLINEIKDQEKESSAAVDNFQTSKSQLVKINKLFDGVTRINEMVYDSAAVDIFTNREYMNVEKLQTNLTHFDTLEFCEKMLTFMDVNRIVEDDTEEGRGVGVSFDSWYKIGCDCSFYMKSPPFFFMYGSYTVEKVEVKKRVVKAREVRDTKNPHTKPLEVKKLQAKDQTTEEVENVLALLNEMYEENDNVPVSYFNFCIDPTSFSTTVENMFYIAFLIKDHAASIFLDENNLPVIAPVTRADNTKKETKQIVMSFDVNEYQELIKCLGIREAVIKRSRN